MPVLLSSTPNPLTRTMVVKPRTSKNTQNEVVLYLVWSSVLCNCLTEKEWPRRYSQAYGCVHVFTSQSPSRY